MYYNVCVYEFRAGGSSNSAFFLSFLRVHERELCPKSGFEKVLRDYSWPKCQNAEMLSFLLLLLSDATCPASKERREGGSVERGRKAILMRVSATQDLLSKARQKSFQMHVGGGEREKDTLSS